MRGQSLTLIQLHRLLQQPSLCFNSKKNTYIIQGFKTESMKVELIVLNIYTHGIAHIKQCVGNAYRVKITHLNFSTVAISSHQKGRLYSVSDSASDAEQPQTSSEQACVVPRCCGLVTLIRSQTAKADQTQSTQQGWAFTMTLLDLLLALTLSEACTLLSCNTILPTLMVGIQNPQTRHIVLIKTKRIP